jgi:hypothetical protein
MPRRIQMRNNRPFSSSDMRCGSLFLFRSYFMYYLSSRLLLWLEYDDYYHDDHRWRLVVESHRSGWYVL